MKTHSLALFWFCLIPKSDIYSVLFPFELTSNCLCSPWAV